MPIMNSTGTDRTRCGRGGWSCALALAVLVGGCADVPEALAGRDEPIVVVPAPGLPPVPAAVTAPATLAATVTAALPTAMPATDLPTAQPVLEMPTDVPISEEKRTDPFHLADVSLEEIAPGDAQPVT